MGYHILIPEEGSDGIEHFHYYIEDIRELTYIDITEYTLIYEGAESQAPYFLRNHEKYKKYLELHYRLGTKAEDLFKRQAKEHKLILVGIDQSQEDFDQYKDAAEENVKRGDFLVRNANLEIDVKCKTIYESKHADYFCLNVSDVKRHMNMMKHTGTPVVIAVYARKEDEPDPDHLYMIEIEKIQANVDTLSTKYTHSLCYRIPLTLTEEGFELIERIKALK